MITASAIPQIAMSASAMQAISQAPATMASILQSAMQSINAAVDGALDKAYAERRDPVTKALNQAHDALGLPRVGRGLAHDSFGKK
jgi:hypothetical protein